MCSSDLLDTLSSNADGLLLSFGATVSDGLASQVLQGLQLSAQAATPLLSLDLRLEPIATTSVAPLTTTTTTTTSSSLIASASAPAVTASLQLTSQWSGVFEGTLTVTNNGSTALSDWSATLLSRYALRNVSNFSLSQTQLADGTWQITLKPPSWGLTLAPGAKATSYTQGVIPGGASLPSLDSSLVLLSNGGGTTGSTSGGTTTSTTTSGTTTTGTTSGGTTTTGTTAGATTGSMGTTSGGTTTTGTIAGTTTGSTGTTTGGTSTGTGTTTGTTSTSTLIPGGRNSGNPEIGRAHV